MDFMDLNKACPKDNFLLVDFTIGHGLLSFTYVFLGNNQILMLKKDEEHTYFITN